MRQGNTDLVTVLQKQRHAILLAEIGALIHDLGKLSEEFVELNASDGPRLSFAHHLILRRLVSGYHQIPTISPNEIKHVKEWLQREIAKLSPKELTDRNTKGSFLNRYDKRFKRLDKDGRRQLFEELLIDEHFLPVRLVTILNVLSIPFAPPLEEISLGDILEHHDTPLCVAHKKTVELLAARFDGCDGVDSAVDKARVEQEGKQKLGDTRIATAFGHEPDGLRIGTDKIEEVRYNYANGLALILERIQKEQGKPTLDSWKELLYNGWRTADGHTVKGLRELAETAFRHALGETRRGANDVTLWDHAYSVASLYKAALARVLVEGWVEPKDVRWQLLYIAFDGLRFLAQAHRVGDLLGRRGVLKDAMDAVKTFIEVELPLGNEVYRDENGIAFVLPWFEQEGNRRAMEETLKQEIEGCFLKATDGELVPMPHFGERAGDLNKKREEALLELGELLGRPRLQCLTPQMVQEVIENWEKARPPERCPICGLRPKREVARACTVCEKRRERRAEEWCKSSDRTIWIDEVVDDYGWVALVAGRFDLTRWLSGEFVQTLLVAPGKPKNPSPARLRRVWETTQRFWQGIAEGEEAKEQGIAEGEEEQGTRQRLIFALLSEEVKDLAWGNYDASLPGSAISFGVFWDRDRGLIVIEHLDYLAQRLGCPREGLVERLTKGGIVLREPSERLERGQEVGRVHPMAYEETLPYAPFIRILTTPRQFLALLPADRALVLAEGILERYEREMGKVRDRLPLTLGVVYFRRHTPLYAVIDAARRLLSCPTREEPWEVTALEEEPLRFANRVTWPREAKLGDGSEDSYYSWVKVEGLANRALFPQVQIDRNMRLWVQAGAFDFEVLDTATRRFAIRYDGNGRRIPRSTRPYLPEQLTEWKLVWGLLADGLTTSQVEALTALVERKREEWGEPLGEEAGYGETFRRFVRDTLINVAGSAWKNWGEEKRTLVETYLRSGRLADVLEVHMEVMKQRPRREG